MSTLDPPVRPDEAGSQRRLERRWLPVLGVIAVILAVTLGPRGVGEALSGPATIEGLVTVHAEAGWSVVTRRDEGSVHQLLLRKGSDGFLVVALAGHGGTAADLAREYVSGALRGEYRALTPADPAPATLASGVTGVRFGYVGVTNQGVTVEGVVVAVQTPGGNGIVFDGFAPEGTLAASIDELGRMIDGAEVH